MTGTRAWVGIALGAALIFAAALGAANGVRPLTAATIALIGGATAAVVLRWRKTVIIAAAAAAAVPCMWLVGLLYATQPSGNVWAPDVLLRTTLFTAALTYLAWRVGQTRRRLTWAAIFVLIPGLIAVQAFPGAGLFIAYTAALLGTTVPSWHTRWVGTAT